jgi:hypothetical protein
MFGPIGTHQSFNYGYAVTITCEGITKTYTGSLYFNVVQSTKSLESAAKKEARRKARADKLEGKIKVCKITLKPLGDTRLR